LEIAAFKAFVWVAFGQPVAAVPELHRAAAVLIVGDGAFEVAVVERMILDLDGEPLDRGIDRRALGHGPRLERTIELQAEVVMQARRVVALDDVAQLLRRRDSLVARGFRGPAEVALGTIGREIVPTHVIHGATFRRWRLPQGEREAGSA